MYNKLIRQGGSVAIKCLVVVLFSMTGVLSTLAIAPPNAPPPPGSAPDPILVGLEVKGLQEMDEDGELTLNCEGQYSDLSTGAVSPLWSVSSELVNIDSSGALTSGNITADLVVLVTASFGGFSDEHEVLISALPEPILESLSISGPGSVDEGANAQYSCTAHYSDGSGINITPGWSANASAAIDSTGLLTAEEVDSDVVIQVSASFGGMTTNISVTVIDTTPVLTGLSIVGPYSLDEETSAQFSCVGSYSDGSTAVIEPMWSENSVVATISASGLLSAGDVTEDQSVTVGASYGGFADTHAVLIRYVVPSLDYISIAGPVSVSEETTGQYTCTAHYSDGTQAAVIPSWSENSVYASISTSGLLSAGDVQSDQSVTVSASYKGKNATKDMTVLYVEPDLESIAVSGAVIVDEGAQTRYDCTAYYSDGTSRFVTPLWSVSSSNALIASDGWLTAGNILEDQVISVIASLEGQSDSLQVTLKYVPPLVVVTGLWVEGADEMLELTNTTLRCFAAFSDATTNEVFDAAWTVQSGWATVADGLLSSGNFEQDGLIQVEASYGGYSAGHEISVEAVPTRIIYPLTGHEGKVILTVIYEHSSDEWSTNGPMEGTIELEKAGEDQWYWVSVVESNTVSGEITEIQANWLHL